MASIIEYKGKKPEVGKNVFLAEGSRLIGDVKIGEDSSVFYNAVLRGDIAPIEVGQQTNIQDNVSIHVSTDVPVKIGNRVTIGHNAVIHSCTIDDDVLVGMGAIIMDGVHIKKNSIVGAGTLVTQGREFPAGSLIVGSPAHISRAVSEEELHHVREGVERYLVVKDELLQQEET